MATSWRRPALSPGRAACLAVAVAVWSLLLLATVGSFVGDVVLGCGPLTPASSYDGVQRISAFPLGVSCSWAIRPDDGGPGTATQGPGWGLTGAVVGLIIWPVTTVGLLRARD